MKYILTSLLCFSYLVSTAQLSIGVRTGASYMFRVDNATLKRSAAYVRTPPEICWDKELFGRYSVKRFSFEVSIDHTKRTDYYFQNLYDASYYQVTPKYVSSLTTSTENFFVFNTLAQYNLNNWGKKKRFRNYIGLSLSPQYRHTKEITTLERYDGSTVEDPAEKYRLFFILPGIDQSFTYDANSHLQFSTHLFFRGSPYSEIPGYRTNSQLALHIGAAYKITP